MFLDVLLTASVAFIITFLATPVILQVAEKKKLYDIPDERKVHTRLIASLGGVGIFAGFILASLLSIQGQFNFEFQYFFAAAIVIFFLGLKDDIMILSASKKFVGQIIAASILIHLGGIRLDSMYGLFGLEQLPEGFGLALSYLTIIVVMNSFNLIDGVDGLAASLGILSMLVFGAYFFAVNMQAYALLSFSMAGSLIAFLIFNHHPARIFMGDSGSLMIGLINSILVIKFINVAHDPSIAIPLTSSVAIGFSILIVPLLDTLRVFGIRIINGRSPFTPDRNHVHHLLLDRGLGHATVTLACVGINVGFIMLAWLGQSLGSTLLLSIMLVLAFSGIGFLYYHRKQHRMVIAKTLNRPAELKTSSKIVKLTKEVQEAQKN
ncbi:MAG: undecaprenyl/decaprenyl-phosphate alpha-N-acetylglucosaminyl 1-phosphate transferase [Chitinophagaceae bacterium]|jgi:UDP-N-acetylmuramyl pentapeptide phosphotransferase/UDP-N-acetylglucosamine-1-phosphate transferase|nr:undecaprenyl/decaprenyl-phosphate alpha-N-acetylglucosaminyl 1-phosphate transferase [Chitinophagaceae bacterium]MBK8300917.1 undecaprenyl/decaprenyl-phosphate alpha-N-acetylglucosaminyl 1-phosphate transferase [Chitinophagaceae bacterium]MBK9465251.1 undecaprenyl/decaprenyl-phosphate alpha-N-acetylglucosaminyl 1-phosphate transferase [Chitinophagaceae bacterium]MBK9660395.1 undecaprenyl/decaprenyl-phosphate alpha-N-acetylglucosaminyl 1-phosphate transferase [Chitinophagaceae bacterium]MBK99